MATETCGTCKFWEASLNECHIDPPAVLPEDHRNNPPVTKWPTTHADTKSCGRWKVVQ